MRRFCVCGLILIVSAPWALAQKKRVAVLDFDFATVQSSVAAIFGSNQDVGKGIADMMVTKLVTDGTYSVIERKALDKILNEQNFSNSDRADASSAAKIGKILGVDAIIIGSITQFGRDDKNISAAGSGFGRYAGRYGLGGVGKHDAKAVVGISARMVDTNTGEILAAVTGHGESKRSGTSLLGGGGGWGGGGGGGLDMGSSNFGNTILGEAVNSAVNDTGAKLEDQAGRLPTRVVHVDGLVADATNGTLIMNVGSSTGLKVGDQLQVERVGRVIKDPSTGKVLRKVETKLGTVTITQVDTTSSVGTYNGSDAPKVGDAVHSIQ